MLVIKLFEILLEFYFSFIGSYGFSIILFSLTLFIFFIPLDLTLKAYENKVSFKKSLMQLELDKLKDVNNKIEKHFYTKIVYNQFKYNPLYSFIPSFKILFQLPFLILSYLTLISYPPFNGVSFWIIDDISEPYAIAFFNGLINPLPVLMALISLVVVFLNKDKIIFKERIIIAITSIAFLLILYDSPSAIVLYWISTNLFYFLTSTLIGNEIKDRIGTFFFNFFLFGYSKLKSNLFLFYILLFNISLIFSAGKINSFLFLHGLVLSIAFVLVLVLAKSNKIIFNFLSIILFSFSIILFDNVFFPYLGSFLRIRYLIFILVIFLLYFRKRVSLIKISNLFFLINSAYLIFSTFMSFVEKANPEFTSSKERSNLVSDFVASETGRENNVIIVVLDGYPSDKVLSDFGIRNNLDSVFKDYTPKQFNSNYFSTPISLSNLFFDVIFEEDLVLETGQNEELLFHDAYSSSSLFPLDPLIYDEVWHSLIKNSSTLGFSYWDPVPVKSVLYNYIPNFRAVNKIISYNDKTLHSLKDNINSGSKKKKFGVYHFLTFHHLNSIGEKVHYANDLIKDVLMVIPNNYSVLFFSDHGLREDSMNTKDKKSGIYYEKKN